VTAELLELATSAAQRAGELLLEHYERAATGVDAKSTPTDLVSDADRESERLIKDLIAKERPDDGFLAEESEAESARSEVTWIIDPLDGTVNYLFRIPAWCVSIAARDPSGMVAGVVHDPNRGETFAASRGSGATLNGGAIAVSDKTELSRALVGTGFAYDVPTRTAQAAVVQRVLPRVRDIRRGGSAALDLSYLACGRLDGFYEAHMMAWDKSAGVLLIEEAGGVVSPLTDPSGVSDGVIAANPALHPALQQLVLGG
jgi:myo-inositol-1(or 4)-monophosphatase